MKSFRNTIETFFVISRILFPKVIHLILGKEGNKMKRMVQRTVATLLVVLLVVSLVPPRIHADAGAGMKQAARLEAGKAVTFTTGVEPVNTYWFKLERNGPSDMTHMQIVMEATKLAHISVYPSADMAGKDETFYPYRASASKEDGTATINLPYAWEGPYYVKVEYMPMEMPDMYPPEESFSLEEGEESEEPPGEPDLSEFASEIELVYNPVTEQGPRRHRARLVRL